jgi:uncharacterized protein YjgD (DUF1641 family)
MIEGTSASRSNQGAPPELAPDPAGSLRRIEASLARLEHRLATAEAQAAAAVSVATDSVDHLVADARARGVDVDARLKLALRLAERLTDPAVASSLELLLAMVPQAPAAVAMAADSVDGVVSRLRASGIDVEARARLLGRAIERLTSPEALDLLVTVLARLDAVRGVLESGVLDPSTTKVVGTAGQALVRTARERIDDGPGALGVLRALGDGDVRAAVGFTLRFAKHFGRSLKAHGLTLPARAP